MGRYSLSEQMSFFGGFKALTMISNGVDAKADPVAKTRCSMNQKRQRRDFTEEFKNDAVKLVTEQGYSCTEVGRRLGVSHTNISRWVRLYRNALDGASKIPDHCRNWSKKISGSEKRTNVF